MVEDVEISQNGGKKDEAYLKLVNLLFDTEDDKLAQLTMLSKRDVFPLSIQMTIEAIDNPNRWETLPDGTRHVIKPLSMVWRTAYFKLLRSVNRWSFMLATGLAHEQATAEAEKAEEEIEL